MDEVGERKPSTGWPGSYAAAATALLIGLASTYDGSTLDINGGSVGLCSPGLGHQNTSWTKCALLVAQ